MNNEFADITEPVAILPLHIAGAGHITLAGNQVFLALIDHQCRTDSEVLDRVLVSRLVMPLAVLLDISATVTRLIATGVKGRSEGH